MINWLSDRTVLRISGAGAFKFLQDLITNDLKLAGQGWCYSALLNAQGKFLVDFFVTQRGDDYFIDAPKNHAQSLLARLNLYKLRRPLVIEATDFAINRATAGQEGPGDFAPDPRHDALGWRQLSMKRTQTDHQRGGDDDVACRVAHTIPQIDAELQPNQSYILEFGFMRLNGVDFKKGCYVGQEVTARMYHKSAPKKGLMRVGISQSVPMGTAVSRDGKAVGTVYSYHQGYALAHLRFDRIGAGMIADDARLTPVVQDERIG